MARYGEIDQRERIEEHDRRLAGESAADRGRDRLERPPVCCCHGEEVKMEADFKLSPVETLADTVMCRSISMVACLLDP